MRRIGWILAAVLALAPAVRAVTVDGKTYAPTVTVDGQSLRLVGAGVREKWFFHVYTLGAYSASGSCDAKALVEAEEPRYMRIDMLRNVEAKKMAETIGSAFEEHLPAGASAELKAQRATFQGYFKEECTEGSVIEFLYVPGQGTTVKQNGKLMGPALPGREFARVLWDIYFGDNSCCGSLKTSVLRCGK